MSQWTQDWNTFVTAEGESHEVNHYYKLGAATARGTADDLTRPYQNGTDEARQKEAWWEAGHRNELAGIHTLEDGTDVITAPHTGETFTQNSNAPAGPR
jgi:hypothetical protein